jgi:tetratricopeptide (TPR) repeat protein
VSDAPNTRGPRELYDDFIKLQWQDIFRTEIHVRLDNGSRYVPNGGSQGVQLLRKGVNAFDEAIRIWSGLTDDPDSGTQGYDRIVDQAGIEYTWEWFLIDPSRPWANAVPELVRDRIEADLDRRDRDALARAKAKAAARQQRIATHQSELPEELSALRRLAVETRDAEAAIAINSAIARQDEADLAALNRLGRAYQAMGMTGEAKKIFHRVLALDPGNTIAGRRLTELNRTRQ